MSIQKNTIAATLLLALTACSSGGKNNTDYLESQVKNLQNKAELAQKKADQAKKRIENAEKNIKMDQQIVDSHLQLEIKRLKALVEVANQEVDDAKKLIELVKTTADRKVKGLVQEDIKLLDNILLLKEEANKFKTLAQKRADDLLKRVEQAELNAKKENQLENSKIKSEIEQLKALANVAQQQANAVKDFADSAYLIAEQKINELKQSDEKVQTEIEKLTQDAMLARQQALETKNFAESAQIVVNQKIAELNQENTKFDAELALLRETTKRELDEAKNFVESLKSATDLKIKELRQAKAKIEEELLLLKTEMAQANNETKDFVSSAQDIANQRIAELNQENMRIDSVLKQLDEKVRQQIADAKNFSESIQGSMEQRIAELNKTNAILLENISVLQEKAQVAQNQAREAEKKALAAQNAALNAQKNPKLLEQIEALKAEVNSAKLEAKNAKQALENTLNSMDQRVKNTLANIEQERKAKLAQLSQMATEQGLPYWEIGSFANDFLDQDLENARSELARRKAEKDKKRLDLIELARNSGVFTKASEYEDFANNYIHSDLSNAQEELNRLSENRERENKRLSLIEMARNSGAFSIGQEYEYERFADNYLYASLDEARDDLAKLKRDRFRNELSDLANGSGLNLDFNEVNDFINQYETQDIVTANQELERRKQEKRRLLIEMARNSGVFASDEEYENFANTHLSSHLNYAEDELLREKSYARERKRTEFIDLLNTYDYSYFNIGEPMTFVEDYLDLDISQFREELEKHKKRRELIQLAESHSPYLDTDPTSFAERYLDSDITVAQNELERIKESRKQGLIDLARDSGLFTEESEYESFANEYLYGGIDYARYELENRRNAERERKRAELVQLAESYSPYLDIDPTSFAERYLDADISEMRQELERLSSERANKIAVLANFAKEQGLSEDDANNFSQYNSHYQLEEGKEQFDSYVGNLALERKHQIDKLRSITIDTPVGLSNEVEKREMPLYDSNGFDTGRIKVEHYKDIYNQKYSAVVGEYNHYSYSSESSYILKIYNPNEPYSSSTAGLFTLENHLPVEGITTYNGLAFTANKQGTLNYTVNFALKEGQGQITGLQGIENIELQKGSIGKRYNQSMGIAGKLLYGPNYQGEDGYTGAYSGSYVLDFYGPKAEEITGVATLSGSADNNAIKELGSYGDIKIGFGGTRGEIQK